MSRIIVKQLPKHINEEKLRNIFGAKGTITDLQLKYTPDGKFRQFCFVGYSNEEEAQAAIKHFHNSCIQANRVHVELCASLGSEDKPQSWSKYAKDSKRNLDKQQVKQPVLEKKQQKVNKVDEIIGKHKDDPEFQEFMQAHDKQRALWANDAALGATEQDNDEDDNEEEQQVEQEAAEEEVEEEPTEKLAAQPISDLEYMQTLKAGAKTTKADKSNLELFTIKIHNVPYNTKRQDVLKFFKPLKPYSVRLPGKVHGFAYVGFKTEKDFDKGMLKNKSFIKGKQVFFSDFTEKNKITKAQREGDKSTTTATSNVAGNAKWQQQQQSLQSEEHISDSGRIFFRNLAYTTTEQQLQELFEKYGPVTEISLPVDKVTRQIKGFGTVTFMMPEHAVLAFNALDGSDFQGRLLHLLPGKELDKSAEEQQQAADFDNLSFKQKKAAKLKQQAQKSIGWNTLFMGANAVAELLAKQFKTTKEQILDTSGGGSSAAVRLALGETQMVIEMKQFLEEEGVRLSAFDEPTQQRSKTIILAKNLPAGTERSELTPIFSKFGPIGRLVLPPSGVTALIEYCEPSEARQAFKKLAFSKFKTTPLFLEWAPAHAFTKTLNGVDIIPKSEPKVEEEVKPAPASEPEPKPTVAEDEDDEPEPETTLFLRNLNFKTVADTVRAHFQHLGSVHTVEIAKRKDAQNPKQLNSLGYGFIQFKKAAIAAQALKEMQMTTIEGNLVELKRSDRVLKTQDDGARRRQIEQKKQTGTKILVRNIPFQARYSEVRDIFKAFGELRSLRIPKKMTPGEDAHRGFGFVDFTSKAEAKRAFEALSASTHLYGRRLVLEWATNEDTQDIDELRKRTAEKFDNVQGAIEAKRSRRAFFDVDSHVPQQAEEDEEEERTI
ncbi:CG3335 [Drosophila busckii]|uniref:CG3335 n=1 Tax=Drosophila busckii TaxID=30019 RepID=A0A0M4ET32_DROBS|nr:probable RNA-binding protein 19 [Drosophila busckii]ALC48638.1 CG3335 [Drosophila busckii]